MVRIGSCGILWYSSIGNKKVVAAVDIQTSMLLERSRASTGRLCGLSQFGDFRKSGTQI